MTETISNVANKYIAALETTYGTEPSPFTSVDFGHIQRITISEEENIEKLNSMNSGHTSAKFEDGLYFANVSIETRITKASVPVVLKAALGSVTDDATNYTASSSLDLVSHSFKVSYLASKTLNINGFVVKDGTISVAKGESVSLTLNGIAKLVTKTPETLTVTTNTDTIYSWLDCEATVGGNTHVLNNFSINFNWNITDDEGRGIETVVSGERRQIQTVLKHRFDVSGSYEIRVSDDAEIGYQDERTDEAIVFTFSRGTDNEHVITLSNTRSSNREYEANIENQERVTSYDFEALDFGVTGDL